MALLDEAGIDAALARLPGWERRGAAITKTYELADFGSAMAFVNRVATAAESANHHPDIDLRWNRVTLTLCTHSEGGLTAKDTALAARFEELGQAGPSPG